MSQDILYRNERANKRYRNTVNNLISPNTVSQNDEKPHTAELDDTAIPHVKIKITEIPHEKSPIPQYRKPPCPPHSAIKEAFSYTKLLHLILFVYWLVLEQKDTGLAAEFI